MPYNKEYYKKNREKILQYQKEWQRKYRARINKDNPLRPAALKAWETRRKKQNEKNN